MDEKKTLTLKCAADNRPFDAEIIDGRIDAQCPRCKTRHTGSAAAWGSIRTDTVSLQAPASMLGRFTITLE